MKKITHHIAKKTGTAKELSALVKIPGSELNSLLLELFHSRTASVTPVSVLNNFTKNRFTIPSLVDSIGFKELEIEWLKLAKTREFVPITLSPLAPLGTCSAFGTVDQNNVVSAVRGTEVVSDATNVLAMLISQQYKKDKSRSTVKYSTTHRHVRGQAFSHPAFSAHFGIFCMVTGGLDEGSFFFETGSLADHLTTHLAILSKYFNPKDLYIKLFIREKNNSLTGQIRECIRPLGEICPTEIVEDYHAGDYYKVVQFKVFLNYKNESVNIVDGGAVDWTQKLTANRKHRFFISGSGIELVHKILKGII